MQGALALAGAAGAVLCLAGHLPGPVRHWAPHAIVLAVMALMVPRHPDPDVLLTGAAAIALACLWTAFTGCPARRLAAVADLAVMVVLTAATARTSHASGMHMTHGSTAWEPWVFLFLTGCWAVARAAAHLHARLGLIRPAARTPRHRLPYRSLMLRESGGLVMVVSMAAMLA
ncbi:hypothetical protein [Streptomyces sp. NPDC046909]|uniref:hypothetical protein n=1 Tax=Streptomyces sp. NPDC046909 TaxID=3155617 RepID=UPI0033DFD188